MHQCSSGVRGGLKHLFLIFVKKRSQELTRVNPERNIFSINVELTSTFLLYRGLVHHYHRILNLEDLITKIGIHQFRSVNVTRKGYKTEHLLYYYLPYFITCLLCQKSWKYVTDLIEIKSFYLHLKGPSMQRWQCPIYNGTLETFI